jgi:hypothetical protein
VFGTSLEEVRAMTRRIKDSMKQMVPRVLDLEVTEDHVMRKFHF